MNYKLPPLLLAAAFIGSSAFAAEKVERFFLDPVAQPERWSPAESTVQLDSVKFSGRPVLKWVAPIDHFAGEKKYPVGWPRMYFTRFYTPKPRLISNWSDWDFVEFDVKIELKNDSANKNCPITFIIASDAPTFNYPLKKLHDGKLHRIRIPVDRITNPAKIVRFGFSIAESNYKHGAKLTVQAGNFHLSRSAECTVQRVKLLTPALTAADTAVKLKLHVSGPANDVARGVPFELSGGPGKKVLRRETLPVQRGEKELEVVIDDLKLLPGRYTLTLFPGNKEKCKAVSFDLLSSPYKVKK